MEIPPACPGWAGAHAAACDLLLQLRHRASLLTGCQTGVLSMRTADRPCAICRHRACSNVANSYFRLASSRSIRSCSAKEGMRALPCAAALAPAGLSSFRDASDPAAAAVPLSSSV